ncbi:MAG: CarD family transcriptional regulator, partial [Rhodothermales bacterium]
MALKLLYQRLASSPAFVEIAGQLAAMDPEIPSSLQVKGLAGSLSSFLLRRLADEVAVPIVCITPDEEASAYLHGDLAQLFTDENRLLRLPSTGHHPYDAEQMDDPGPLVRRADVLQQLAEGFSGLIVTSLDAVFELVPPAETVRRETISIVTGGVFSPNDLAAQLIELGFERVEFVEQPGELALRGGILDVYPFAGDYPIRAEFFGDEIDSIREFDPGTQRSVSRLTAARLVPNLERRHAREARTYASIFEHLPDETLIATFDEQQLVEKVDELFARAATAFEDAVKREPDTLYPLPNERYLTGEHLERSLIEHSRLLLGSFAGSAAAEVKTFDSQPQPDFNGNVALLRKKILQNSSQSVETFILCDSRGQEARLFELLEEEATEHKVHFSVESLHQGFEVPDLGLAVYTDHQIFNRYHRPSTRGRKQRYGGLSLREIQNLSPGDFVVHVDYGIGRFAGLHKITVRERQQEAVKLLFQDEDVLYVNVNALYKLHKYSGKEGHQPRLTKLGSGQWERAKARTKKKVKDIARDLIRLYAKRKASQGLSFSADTIWQREMEASFRYEDTPDQAVAADAVKRDMEQPVPMDR